MKQTIYFTFLISLFVLLGGCSTSESEVELEKEKENLFEQKFKNKEVIMYTRAFRSNGERTVGEKGMPVKFKFDYNSNEPNKLYFEMPEFQFGNMPLAATISGKLDIINKYVDAYPEKKNWIYFGSRSTKATAGSYIYNEKGDRIQYDSSPSAEVNGYYNPDTNEIFMDINFKLMSVTSISPDQPYDAHPVDQYLALLDNYYDMHRQIDKVRNKMFNFSNQSFNATFTDAENNSIDLAIPLSFSYDLNNPNQTRGKLNPIRFELNGKEYTVDFEGDIDFLFNPDPPIYQTWKTPIHTKLLQCKTPRIAKVVVDGQTSEGAILTGLWRSSDWLGDNYQYANLRLTEIDIRFNQGLKLTLTVGSK
ncbi:DUF4903 family protein [Myroides odoratus]